jgi:hypothetical protein
MVENQDMRMMEIGFADGKDYDYLVANDRHVTPEMIRRRLEQNR